jgi:hypothetical protein
MNINIIEGAFVDGDPAFRTKYPHNLVPVIEAQGISQGYLRPGDGIVEFTTYAGFDRGGIAWDGIDGTNVLYRVKGSKLVTIDPLGVVVELGDVGNDFKQCTLVYSFDRLAIASDKRLFYYSAAGGFEELTDLDLGVVLDVVYIDGYFMTTDGENLVVTDLNDPMSVNPLKYGSSEIDPDPIVGLIEYKNEVYALNTTTIEVFDNVGGELFPFARIDNAQIDKGAIGAHASTVLDDIIAFIGRGRNEALAVYLGMNGRTQKISTREIDEILLTYDESKLADIVVESRIDRGHEYLYVHLPDITLVYDRIASADVKMHVWFTLGSGIDEHTQYRARGMIFIYGKWISGDPTSEKVGYFIETAGHHYDQVVTWSFGTKFTYNESKGAIFNELELVALTGEIEVGKDPVIYLEWTDDGRIYSQKQILKAGKSGNRARRLRWFQLGAMEAWRAFVFAGSSDAHLTFARLEGQLEPLAW